jgi:hypothetical protein
VARAQAAQLLILPALAAIGQQQEPMAPDLVDYMVQQDLL